MLKLRATDTVRCALSIVAKGIKGDADNQLDAFPEGLA